MKKIVLNKVSSTAVPWKMIGISCGLIIVDLILWIRGMLLVAIPGAIVIVIWLILLGYQKEASTWTGFGASSSFNAVNPLNANRRGRKTLWDWLQLLIIPMLLAGGAVSFNMQQSEVSRSITADQQKEATLNTYMNDISDLLLNHSLATSKFGDQVQYVARAKTLSALRVLNPERKNVLMRFLSDTGILFGQSGKPPVLRLNDADLSDVNLSGVKLYGAYLSATNFMGARLDSANLAFANLDEANLHNVDLNHADLFHTHFCATNLSGVQLGGTSLSTAHLTGATLPNGAIYQKVDQDCKNDQPYDQ
jgi:Pentapeptide repeats (9 copies)